VVPVSAGPAIVAPDLDRRLHALLSGQRLLEAFSPAGDERLVTLRIGTFAGLEAHALFVHAEEDGVGGEEDVGGKLLSPGCGPA